MLLNEFGELLRCPCFSFGIEHDDSIRGIERGKQLRIFDLCDLQPQKMPNAADIVFAKFCLLRILRLSDPDDSQFQ